MSGPKPSAVDMRLKDVAALFICNNRGSTGVLAGAKRLTVRCTEAANRKLGAGVSIHLTPPVRRGRERSHMTRCGSTLRILGLAIVAAVALVGCGSSSSKGDTSPNSPLPATEPSLAASVPQGYDPCKDIPADVLSSENLTLRGQADAEAAGGVKWRGCRYGRSNGYVVSIRTTNLTVEVVRAKQLPEAQEFTIASRRAISTRQFDGPYIKEACTVDVSMQGGSLEFNLNNPASNRDTGSVDSCELARTLAEKVVPTMPATA
ncbi:DUF3558 domain-containing protein [Nocardia gipuzkoensis]